MIVVGVVSPKLLAEGNSVSVSVVTSSNRRRRHRSIVFDDDVINRRGLGTW